MFLNEPSHLLLWYYKRYAPMTKYFVSFYLVITFNVLVFYSDKMLKNHIWCLFKPKIPLVLTKRCWHWHSVTVCCQIIADFPVPVSEKIRILEALNHCQTFQCWHWLLRQWQICQCWHWSGNEQPIGEHLYNRRLSLTGNGVAK